MSSTVTLRFERRTKHGREYIAPFIDGYNGWDVPVEEWTPVMEKLIKESFLLGYQTAMWQLKLLDADVKVEVDKPLA